jgi:hypothetical protein
MLRRTPLKRGTSKLSRSPLRKVSKKYAKGLRVYSSKRREFLALHPHCAAGPVLGSVKGAPKCDGFSSQIHHMERRGPNLNAEATWLATCPTCHRFIETHANLARQIGLLA